MILATGVDILEIDRVQRLWQRSGDRFLQRVFTAAERDYCLRKVRPAASPAAAAAQSLPDVAVMLNSSRLLRRR